jgi:hypothetical protein
MLQYSAAPTGLYPIYLNFIKYQFTGLADFDKEYNNRARQSEADFFFYSLFWLLNTMSNEMMTVMVGWEGCARKQFYS